MYLLRIEHRVPDYDSWKRAFDGDPLGRRHAGVRRYRILRAVEDRHVILIDLEFDSRAAAEAMFSALGRLWGQVEGTVIESGSVRIVEVMEAGEG